MGRVGCESRAGPGTGHERYLHLDLYGTIGVTGGMLSDEHENG